MLASESSTLIRYKDVPHEQIRIARRTQAKKVLELSDASITRLNIQIGEILSFVSAVS